MQWAANERVAPQAGRVRAEGKFFRLGQSKWYLKGFTYGPFAPNRDGEHLPERPRLLADLAHIRQLGANAIRLYHVPKPALLDDALEHGLRVFVDVPWEKHRCFFEDWCAQDQALKRVRQTARELGNHPGTFAISVGNEIPKDIVRFYGHRRIERFLNELMDAAKQEAPDCLVTYTNYPSTEFLSLARADFTCFNVYLQDPTRLSAYLDRLQHLAGSAPLILGEFGVDSIRNSQQEQSRQISEHVRRVFDHGLAGSFVFAYTDDWYTGGAQIDDWAFGVTDRQRQPKPAAAALSKTWQRVPHVVQRDLPRVSVVVCSYNGARTLEECLRSLTKLNYPDYEVILVDDGSRDNSRAIARKFPSIHYIYQTNHGLSVARNVGAQAATGKIVAYTDSDCVVDEDWLMYLVGSMLEQKVDAIGGPNVPPLSDGWTAKCVAASPGGPSHVMSDDQTAEHVPGCNMAFDRNKLLSLGGFDARYRTAGDDIDMCWRFMDAGMRIGYAPAALVWHYRRNTVRAYLKQQAGYGRSEAMVHAKHPHRFNRLGNARWKGVIYGEGSVALPSSAPQIHHGRFGEGLFQIIYRQNDYSIWGYLTLLEWHALALLMLLGAIMFPPLALISTGMWCATLAAAVRSVRSVNLPRNMPRWCVGVIFFLHLAQPVVRAWHRYRYRLFDKRRTPDLPVEQRLWRTQVRHFGLRRADLYWRSQQNRGREELIAAMQRETILSNVEVNFDSEWTSWDAILAGDLWNNVVVHTATEELGWPKKFTRARCTLRLTPLSWIAASAAVLWSAAALAAGNWWTSGAGLGAMIYIGGSMLLSQRRCLNTATRLMWRSGRRAKLEGVTISAPQGKRVPLRELALSAERAPVAVPEVARTI